MKTARHTALLTAAITAALGCGKIDSPQDGSRVAINISTQINENCETKGPVFPTETNGDGTRPMPKGSSFGLFICDHFSGDENPYKAHSKGYKNIQASRNTSNGSWYYSYNTFSNLTSLYIMTKRDDKDNSIPADMFAYAPFQSSMPNPEKITYNITSQYDMMYAVENAETGINKNIDPAKLTEPYSAKFTFKHSLALLKFNFKLLNGSYGNPEGEKTDGGYTLTSVKITKGNPEAKLYKSGYFNAITGKYYDLTDMGESITLNGSYPSYLTVNEKLAYLMLIPPDSVEGGSPEYVDGDYVLTFTFNGITLSESSFTIRKEHLKHSDETNGTTFGFKAGYLYNFYFTIDNYVHFTGIKVGEWTDADKPLFETEI